MLAETHREANVRSFLTFATTIVLAAAVLTACSEQVELPPASLVPISPSGESPAPPPTETPSPPPTDPNATVIDGCVIQPETVCVDAFMPRSELAGADLHGADLTEANLVSSDLRNVNFQNATLEKTNLRNTDISGADFSGADLTGARMQFANASGADFEGADLSPDQIDEILMCRTIRPDGRRDDSNCASTGGSTDDSGPEIENFSVEPATVSCPSNSNLVTVSVEASWSTKRTKTVTIEVDGKPLPDDQEFSKSGSIELEYACKKDKHTYTLVATGSEGLETERSQTVKAG